MCFCTDHDRIQAEIAGTDTMNNWVGQAVDCHFFYRRSTLEECAMEWGMSLDRVREVSRFNLKKDGKFYDVRRDEDSSGIIGDGDIFEIIPNDKWFAWAKKHPGQNHVYDEEKVKCERDRRGAIERNSGFRNPKFTVTDFEMCLKADSATRECQMLV